MYVERRQRLACTLNYILHVCHDPDKGLLPGVVFELLLDRNSDNCTTANKKWFQRSEESVLVTGMYMHLRRLYRLQREGASSVGSEFMHPPLRKSGSTTTTAVHRTELSGAAG